MEEFPNLKILQDLVLQGPIKREKYIELKGQMEFRLKQNGYVIAQVPIDASFLNDSQTDEVSNVYEDDSDEELTLERSKVETEQDNHFEKSLKFLINKLSKAKPTEFLESVESEHLFEKLSKNKKEKNFSKSRRAAQSPRGRIALSRRGSLNLMNKKNITSSQFKKNKN